MFLVNYDSKTLLTTMNGQQIRLFMQEHRLRVGEVANVLGITQQTFSATLKSEDVKSSVVERIAAYAGVPVSALYGETAGTSYNSNNINNGRDQSIGDCAALMDRALGEIAEQRKLAQTALALVDKLTNK